MRCHVLITRVVYSREMPDVCESEATNPKSDQSYRQRQTQAFEMSQIRRVPSPTGASVGQNATQPKYCTFRYE